MTAARIVDPAGVLGEALSGASPDLMRHLLGTVINSCCRPKQTRCAAPSGVSRLLHTGEQLLTDRQRERIDAAPAGDAHAEVEVTWAVYRQIVAPYRDPDRAAGRRALHAVIDSLRRGVPAALVKLRRLGRTPARRAGDVLAYFDLPGTSNGLTEAVNGRLEHLRGSALGFRNLTNHIARSLLEAAGFRPQLHPQIG